MIDLDKYRIIDYTVVLNAGYPHDNPNVFAYNAFNDSVMKAVKNGWVPLGGVGAKGVQLYQAMVRIEKK